MGPPPDLILASASPRRRELLERLGLRVHVCPVALAEDPLPGEAPLDLARRLAGAKCDVAALVPQPPPIAGLPILAADTVVALGGEPLGKPAGPAQARDVLGKLAGRRHEVVTAFRVRLGERFVERAVTTAVAFRSLDPAEIEAYLESGEWQGKAGGYAVQGIAAAFITELRGSHTNVIGLPLPEALADLRALGALPRYPPPGFGVP